MRKTLMHWLRLMFEPDHHGLISNQPKRWQVIYPDGMKSMGMGYRMACDYAEIFGGTVHRYKKEKRDVSKTQEENTLRDQQHQ